MLNPLSFWKLVRKNKLKVVFCLSHPILVQLMATLKLMRLSINILILVFWRGRKFGPAFRRGSNCLEPVEAASFDGGLSFAFLPPCRVFRIRYIPGPWVLGLQMATFEVAIRKPPQGKKSTTSGHPWHQPSCLLRHDHPCSRSADCTAVRRPPETARAAPDRLVLVC